MSKLNERYRVYSAIRDSSLEVLTRPAVLEALGESAGVIVGGLEDAVFVDRNRRGLKVADPDLLYSNVGIHSLLPADKVYPSIDGYIPIHPDEPQASKADILKQYFKSKPKMDHEEYIAGLHASTWEIENAVEQPRLLVTGSVLDGQFPETLAVILGHELDHCDKLNQYDGVTTVVSHGTMLEKSAYSITAAIVESTSGVPEYLCPSDIQQAVAESDNPFIAAWRLGNMFNILKETIGSDFTARLIPKIAFTAYGALALSERFGDGTARPTVDEQEAYVLCGYVG